MNSECLGARSTNWELGVPWCWFNKEARVSPSAKMLPARYSGAVYPQSDSLFPVT
jgi:hypothetical protein